MDIKSYGKIAKQLSEIIKEEKKKARNIMAIAMNMTIKEVKQEIVNEMNKIFDNPTPYTLNSVYIVPAKDDKLFVRIGLKDWTAKGTPAAKYLSAQIEGGARAAKSSERKLRDAGILKSDQFIVPGKGIRLNKYGNIPGSKIVQILSAVSAFDETGYLMNISKASKKRNPSRSKYFVVKEGNKSKLHPGIYERLSNSVKPVLMFVRMPKYSKRFAFFELSEKYYNQKLKSNINKVRALIK